jgi:hypothetical protein
MQSYAAIRWTTRQSASAGLHDFRSSIECTHGAKSAVFCQPSSTKIWIGRRVEFLYYVGCLSAESQTINSAEPAGHGFFREKVSCWHASKISILKTAMIAYLIACVQKCWLICAASKLVKCRQKRLLRRASSPFLRPHHEMVRLFRKVHPGHRRCRY